MSIITAVFFDLGDTLGVPVFDADRRLLRFEAFRFSAVVLGKLQAAGPRLGVISNTGDEPGTRLNELLREAGLLAFFDPTLLLYSKDLGRERVKDTPEIFDEAAKLVGAEWDPAQCLFVGEDARERDNALRAGWRVCPHPLLVEEVLAGETLRYVRMRVPEARQGELWRAAVRGQAVVPLHVEGPGGSVVYALTSQRVAAELMSAQFRVSFLGDAETPLRTELYLLRDDEAKTTGFLRVAGEAPKLFAQAESARTVLESEAGRILVALPPEVTLESIHFENARHGHTLRLMPDPNLLAEPPKALVAARAMGFGAAEGEPTAAEVATWAELKAPPLLERVERFTGQRPLRPDGPTIRSRHVLHADNRLAVAELAKELEALAPGRLEVLLHTFSHLNRTLENVVARLPGQSPELVLVTAHLDSIAMPNAHATDPAPGADDDMSGVAGVLAVAERILALTGGEKPARTLEFVLFNDEENGLVGSKAYARHLRDRGAEVAGVFQMDMIGFNREEPRSWEVHVGFTPSAATEARSLVLAQLVQAAAAAVSPSLPAPQIYGPGMEDPAEQRSDHGSFQQYGWAGCCVSEDFFIGPHGHGDPEPNPNYHGRGDLFVDAEYAADIARAVGAAAWKLASSQVDVDKS